MPKFVDQGEPDLLPRFLFRRTDSLDVLLVKDDVIRSAGNIEDASLRHRHTVVNAEKQLLGMRRLVGRRVLDKNGDVLDLAAEFFGEQIERLLDDRVDRSRVISRSNSMPKAELKCWFVAWLTLSRRFQRMILDRPLEPFSLATG